MNSYVTKKKSLKKDLARLLSIELGSFGSVCWDGEQVTVIISRTEFEQNYGKRLLQMHRAIEEYYPEREEDLFITIRDQAGLHQNVIKVWRSV
jgi:hypothetical protein